MKPLIGGCEHGRMVRVEERVLIRRRLVVFNEVTGGLEHYRLCPIRLERRDGNVVTVEVWVSEEVGKKYVMDYVNNWLQLFEGVV